ncbi:hypothetical protein RchiOBHm_Chr5g0019471 [Rosa chinensis]|uniref:Uncharacterized protein n=1 Tax=Rosa chinensis TaxID=74649 RepID=A0A2P6Q712_ROSCH|nr:hypothetical protein RchiOBHm_Chr5g0019471 [Rosa chinensis]
MQRLIFIVLQPGLFSLFTRAHSLGASWRGISSNVCSTKDSPDQVLVTYTRLGIQTLCLSYFLSYFYIYILRYWNRGPRLCNGTIEQLPSTKSCLIQYTLSRSHIILFFFFFFFYYKHS